MLSACVFREQESFCKARELSWPGSNCTDEEMTTVRRCNLRLSDVHATAETVGSEFKKLADRFGMECVAELLTPVVQTLEWLEAYVESYQQLQTTVSELEMENDTLEYEREQRALLGNKNEVKFIATNATG